MDLLPCSFNTILNQVSVQKKKVFVERVLSYWMLKRQSRNGVPLIRRLQTAIQTQKEPEEVSLSRTGVIDNPGHMHMNFEWGFFFFLMTGTICRGPSSSDGAVKGLASFTAWPGARSLTAGAHPQEREAKERGGTIVVLRWCDASWKRKKLRFINFFKILIII